MTRMSCSKSLFCTSFPAEVMSLLEQDLRWNTTELIWIALLNISICSIKGTIAAWKGSKGYLVNFEDGDQEWLQSVGGQDVRLFD